MDIGEVKVTERQQNAGPCVFRVQERAEHVTVRSGSMMAKISLCLGVLLIALVLELGGTAAREQRQVFAAEGEPLPEPTAQEREETLGALYYVEAGSPGPEAVQEAEIRRVKWTPPVKADEVILLREDSVIGFSALDTQVVCCCGGQVFAVGEDEDWGKYVRIRSAGDVDAVYYGLEGIEVRAGQTVDAGALLGTVPLGRRVYLAVSEKGAPQDPRTYVSLTVQKQA
jgi:hypothetical protein